MSLLSSLQILSYLVLSSLQILSFVKSFPLTICTSPAKFATTISCEKLCSSKNNFPIFSPERANISRAEKYWPDFNILCKFQRGNGCLHQRASCRHLCRSTPRSSRRRGCSTGSPPSPWSPCQTSWRVIPEATTRRPTIGMRCLAG